MIPRQADVRFTIIVLILAVLALAFGGRLIADPPIPLSSDLLAMNPRVFPFLILLGTVVVALIFLLNEARAGAFSATRMTQAEGESSTTLWREAVFLFITVTSALLLSTLGFITTMFLLMSSTAVLVGNRSPIQILSISILIPVSFFIIVTHILRTALPEADIVQRFLAPLIRLLPAF